MKRATFKIRRRVITTFLFCVLSVLIFAVFSYQIHREIGHRLKLVELTDDLFHNILEARRFEKNFFLYKQPASLNEVMSYVQRVEDLYQAHEPEILRLKRGPLDQEFYRILESYKQLWQQIGAKIQQHPPAAGLPDLSHWEDPLRNLGQNLVEMTERWEKEERALIDRLSQRAMYLFFVSVLVFVALGILVAFYLARLLVRPMVRMQQAMEKIAHGDYTPIPEPECR